MTSFRVTNIDTGITGIIDESKISTYTNLNKQAGEEIVKIEEILLN